MKPIEIKVKGCEGCPFWNYDLYADPLCTHPYNMYDGNKYEFIEHCPLKETDTIIKFVRE